MKAVNLFKPLDIYMFKDQVFILYLCIGHPPVQNVMLLSFSRSQLKSRSLQSMRATYMLWFKPSW